MAEYAVMPLADYEDACDAVREKTGGTDVIKSGELGTQIRGISGGGSGEGKVVHFSTSQDSEGYSNPISYHIISAGEDIHFGADWSDAYDGTVLLAPGEIMVLDQSNMSTSYMSWSGGGTFCDCYWLWVVGNPNSDEDIFIHRSTEDP